jgi:hypothetical protein
MLQRRRCNGVNTIGMYQSLNETDKYEFARIVKTLLSQTFILERIFDKGKGKTIINPMYRKVERFQLMLSEYFQMMEIDLQFNKRLGLVCVNGTTFKTYRLDKLTTIYLLLLKLIYEEKQKTVSTEDIIVVTIEEIQEKIETFQLLEKLPTFTSKKKAFDVLRRFQLIDYFSGDLGEIGSVIVYPSISILLKNNEIKEMLTELGGSTDENNPAD